MGFQNLFQSRSARLFSAILLVAIVLVTFASGLNFTNTTSASLFTTIDTNTSVLIQVNNTLNTTEIYNFTVQVPTNATSWINDSFGVDNLSLEANTSTLFNITLSANASGNYSVYVIAILANDSASMLNSSELTMWFNVSGAAESGTAPASSINSPDAFSWTRDTTPQITFTLTDTEDAVINYTIFVDGTANLTGSASNNTATSINLSALSEAAHSVIVRATDSSDTATNSSAVVITVDATAPSVSISSPVNDSLQSSNTLQLYFVTADNLDLALNYTVYMNSAPTNISSTVRRNMTDYIAFWSDMIDGAGTTVSDEGPQGTEGTLHVGLWNNTDKPANLPASVEFTGSQNLSYPGNSRTNVGDQGENYTYGLWFKTVNDTNTFMGLAGMHHYIGVNQGEYPVNLNLNWTGILHNSIFDGTNNPTSYGVTDLIDGLWHHVVVVRDTAADVVRVYVDGVETAAYVDTTSGNMSQNAPFTFGYNNASQYYFQGKIAQPFLLNTAFSSEDVATLYNNGNGMTYNNFVGDTGNIQNVTLTEIADGTHTITVQVEDDAGNVANATEITVTFDATAPTSTITSPANGSTNADGDFLLEFNITDNQDSEISYTIYINDVADVSGNVTNATGGNGMLMGLAEGANIVSVQATDSAGTSVNSTPVSLIADLTNPSVIIGTSGYTTNNSTVVINFTPSDNLDTSISWNLTIDSVFNVSGSTASGEAELVTILNVTEGEHVFDVVVVDNAGRTATPNTAPIVTVDLTAPTITIISPLNDSHVSDTTPEFSFIITDNASNNLTYIQYRPDGSEDARGNAANNTLTSFNHSFTLGDINTYAYLITAVDEAGNVANSSAVYFTIDITPPTANIIYPTNGPLNDTTPQITFNLSDIVDSSIRYTIYVDAVAGTSGNATNITPTSVNLSTLSEGSHSLLVQAEDTAGNAANSTPLTVIIDTSILTSTITSPTAGSTSSDATPQITFYVTSTASEIINYTIYVNDVTSIGNTTPNGTLTSVNLTTLSDGSHTVLVQATNSNGIGVNSTPVTFSVDTSNPTALLISPTNEQNISDSTPDVALRITDNIDATINYTLYLNGSAVATGAIANESLTHLNLSNLGDGFHGLILEAVDEAGNTDNSSLTTFRIDTISPEVGAVMVMASTLESVSNGGTVNVTQANVTINWTLTDVGADYTNITINGVPIVSYIATIIEYNASLSGGTTNFTITAVDLANNSGTFSFLITTSLPINVSNTSATINTVANIVAVNIVAANGTDVASDENFSPAQTVNLSMTVNNSQNITVEIASFNLSEANLANANVFTVSTNTDSEDANATANATGIIISTIIQYENMGTFLPSSAFNGVRIALLGNATVNFSKSNFTFVWIRDDSGANASKLIRLSNAPSFPITTSNMGVVVTNATYAEVYIPHLSGVAGGEDGTPPIQSGNTSDGVTETTATLSITTNEIATCKYSTVDQAYNIMENIFDTTNSTSHSTSLIGLNENTDYTYYVRCADEANNAASSSSTISFTTSAAASGGSGGGGGGGGGGLVRRSANATSSMTNTTVTVPQNITDMPTILDEEQVTTPNMVTDAPPATELVPVATAASRSQSSQLSAKLLLALTGLAIFVSICAFTYLQRRGPPGRPPEKIPSELPGLPPQQ